MSLIAAASVAIGLHLGSAHFPDNGAVNNVNPGIYARIDSVTVGTYRNSLRRQSVYAAYSFERGPFAASVGAITGYQGRNGVGHSRTAVSPLLVLSIKGPEVFGVTPRLAFVPGHLVKSANVVHLMVEKGY